MCWGAGWLEGGWVGWQGGVGRKGGAGRGVVGGVVKTCERGRAWWARRHTGQARILVDAI